MKKQASVQKQNRTSLKGLLLMILVISATGGYSAPPVGNQQRCIITDLQRTTLYQGAVLYSWSPVSGATEYKVSYVRLADNYVSSVTTTSSTSITFTGLQAGAYRFFLAPVCGNDPLEYIADDLILI